MRTSLRLLLSFVVVFWIGVLGGVHLEKQWTHKTTNSPQNLPEIRLPDGGLVLRQNPAEPAPVIHHLPKGYKVQAVARVEIKPGLSQDSGSIGAIQTLTVAQIATKEGPRVVVESDTGQIIGGAAWTMVGPPAPHVFHWQAQAVRAWGPQGASWGASIGYTKGPFIATAAVFPASGLPAMIQAGIGVRW